MKRFIVIVAALFGVTFAASADERPIEKPEVCPACGSRLIARGAHLFCMNRETCRETKKG